MSDDETLWLDVERMLQRDDLSGVSPECYARVMRALREVPRGAYVPDPMKRYAFSNEPLPIGHGQTISQPYIVALMTLLLAPEPHHRVLEVGTGSGYQAAILARLVERVYSLEVLAPLAEAARDRLAGQGVANVEVRHGDGHGGWPEEAPFDAVIVTAAPSQTPQALLDQLRPGGRMVIPVGHRYMPQRLLLYRKGAEGEIDSRFILPVAFVPMTGGGVV